MIPTIPFIQQTFDRFNRLIFNNALPPLSIELCNVKTFMGQCVYKRKRTLLGKIKRYDFKLRINTRAELSQNECEDVILHEMIHYYIGYNQLKDTSAHGRIFRKMMNDINTRYGRHVTISHRSTSEQREALADKRRRQRIIAVVTFHDGRTGVKVLPHNMQRIHNYHHHVIQNSEVASVQLYRSNNPYFNCYPISSALRVHFLDDDTIATQLHDAHLLTDAAD